MFDWGDGNFSDWIGPVASGTSVSAAYSWPEAGSYGVRVKATDGTSESGWSYPWTVTIIQGPMLEVRPIQSGLLQLDIPIKNSGSVDATDVTWSIELDGGAFIGASHQGTGFTVPAEGTAILSSGFILGLGPTVVTVTIEYGDGGVATRSQDGFVLLFFINIIPSGG
jgi:hypothetical protein